jgi:hypothetical protein
MNIQQSHKGDTPVDIIIAKDGKAYINLDGMISTLRAWAKANKEQVALMGLLREVIKIRNKHQSSK